MVPIYLTRAQTLRRQHYSCHWHALGSSWDEALNKYSDIKKYKKHSSVSDHWREKKSRKNVMLLLFLFTLDKIKIKKLKWLYKYTHQRLPRVNQSKWSLASLCTHTSTKNTVHTEMHIKTKHWQLASNLLCWSPQHVFQGSGASTNEVMGPITIPVVHTELKSIKRDKTHQFGHPETICFIHCFTWDDILWRRHMAAHVVGW